MIIEIEGFYVSGGSKSAMESYTEVEYITKVLSNWKVIEGIDVNKVQYTPDTFSYTYRKDPILIRRGGKLEVPKVEEFKLFYEVEKGEYMYKRLTHYAHRKTTPVLSYIDNSPYQQPFSSRSVDLDFQGDPNSEIDSKECDLSITLGIINDSELAVQLITTISKKHKKIITKIDFL